MRDDAKQQLKTILGNYDEKLADVERRDVAMRAAYAAFPERFAALKKDLIRPALQEFVEMLDSHGHQATAREQEESSSTAGGVTSAAISLRIIPKPFAHRSVEANNSCIEITFSANRAEQKIVVSATNTILNARGSLGKRGEYDLESFNADIIAGHVLKTLQEALAEARR